MTPRQFLLRLGLAAGLAAAPLSVGAQGLFSAVVEVNDSAVTRYELDQRIRLLDAFNTPGDLPEVALEQLIEDRLKLEELARRGLELTDENLRTAMGNFAEQANQDLDTFIASLAAQGVAEETFRDYVRVGVSWRDYVRLRFGNRVEVTEEEVDRAIRQSGQATGGIEVLLSEIILPARPQVPGEVAEAQAAAERITRITSFGAFSEAAEELSALPTAEEGGRLDWQPLTTYPAPIQQILLDLSPGEVTRPLEIQNGIALFQLRDVREVPQAPPAIAQVEYAVYAIPGGRSVEAMAEAAAVGARVDTCDDLYGINQGQPSERLVRQEVAPGAVPQGIALELAKLDPGEFSYGLTGAANELLFVMLCSRTPEAAAAIDREQVRLQILNARLTGYADGLLAELRAAATIVGG